MQRFRKFVHQLGQELNLPDLQPDANGLISLSIDKDCILNLQFLPVKSRALIFLPVFNLADLPESFLRKMLSANLFGRGTGGGWFGLEEESGTIVYHYLTDMRKLPPPDKFIQLLEQILKITEHWQKSCRRCIARAAKSQSAQ